MDNHDTARRAFLKGAAVSAGAVASGALVPDAHAQHADHATPQTTAQAHAHGGGLGAFLNAENATAIAAFTDRLWPSAPGMPGARDADVTNYIDLALAGAYSDLQDFYRRGLSQLDDYCNKTHGKSFALLDAAKQDEVLTALEKGTATGFTWPRAQAFFNTVRTHAIEGMFADPVYGGNKDFAGWKLVGFPGAQPAFTPEDMQSREAFTRAPFTGLQAQAPMRKG
jgi:gluconate 2-dehydrogenase gamma chain